MPSLFTNLKRTEIPAGCKTEAKHKRIDELMRPENLAIMRRVALNLARAKKSKGAMRGKLKKAGWHAPYMLDFIRAAFHVQKR